MSVVRRLEFWLGRAGISPASFSPMVHATTLRRWRENFFAAIDTVRKLGYPEHFNRMWEFYLCYCEAGFMEQALGDVHMLLVKPQARHEPLLSI